MEYCISPVKLRITEAHENTIWTSVIVFDLRAVCVAFTFWASLEQIMWSIVNRTLDVETTVEVKDGFSSSVGNSVLHRMGYLTASRRIYYQDRMGWLCLREETGRDIFGARPILSWQLPSHRLWLKIAISGFGEERVAQIFAHQLKYSWSLNKVYIRLLSSPWKCQSRNSDWSHLHSRSPPLSQLGTWWDSSIHGQVKTGSWRNPNRPDPCNTLAASFNAA